MPTISLDRSPQLFCGPASSAEGGTIVGSTDRSCSCPAGRCPHLVLVVGESPTAQSAEQIVEIPVPSGDLQGSRPGHSFRCALLSRSLTFQFRVVVGGWCRSSRFSPSTASSSSPGAVDEAFHGFFRTFPRFQKSAESGRQCGDDGSCRSRRALQLMDVGGF